MEVSATSVGLVTAVFYNFAPRKVARALPDAWSVASPTEFLRVRLEGADDAFGRDRGWWWAPDGTQIMAVRGAGTSSSLHLLDLYGGWVDVHWDRETYPYLVDVHWHGTFGTDEFVNTKLIRVVG